ncbi:unnamed protein product, partial [Musa hybrid cultivar]
LGASEHTQICVPNSHTQFDPQVLFTFPFFSVEAKLLVTRQQLSTNPPRTSLRVQEHV